MAKKTVNSDIYNLANLVDGVKSTFIPDENEETLAVGTYGYIGALETKRLQTQVQMTGELCNEVFPSRARLDRNVITHAIMTNIEDINAIPSKMTAFLAIKENDILDKFDTNNIFTIDRECPLYIGDFEFHLEYDIKLKRIFVERAPRKKYTYTAQYDIPANRDVPTSTITSANQYLSPPAVVKVGTDSYIYLTVILSQVQHNIESKKLVTSNIIDNKTMNFTFEDQLAYFEVHCIESDEEYYITPVFEGASVPESNAQYYCWYQYIDTNLVRIRFDRKSYMPGLNTNVECLIKTCKGAEGNFTYADDTYVTLKSEKYGYDGVTALLTPASNASGGKDRKSKKELQSLIPKESLARGCLTTITDLNNYFSMLDSEYGRIIIQKKIDNQIERVYYAYFVAKDENLNIIPSNTIDIKVGLKDLIKSTISETDSPRYLLPSGMCFRLGEDGIAYVNKIPLLGKGYTFTPKGVVRGGIVEDIFTVYVTEEGKDLPAVSCAVDVGGSQTRTHIFPAEGDDRFTYVDSKEESIVEDFMQFGTGQKYTYTSEYVVENNDSIISARDKYFDCLEFEDAYYTADGATKHFSELPILAYGLTKGTKVTFGITRKLNEKAKGILTFKYGDQEYKLHQKLETKLSTVLMGLGITTGKVTDAISSDDTILSLIENGTIDDIPHNPEEEEPNPPEEEEDPTIPEEDNPVLPPYRLTVEKTENLPDVDDREENQWYYAVNKAEPKRNGKEVTSNMGSTGIADENYTLTVVNEDEAPAVEDRPENNYYYIVTGTSIREITPDDPDDPDEPTELHGKEYKVKVLQSFMDPITITVTIDGVDHDITVTQNRFLIENGIYVSENNIQMQKDIYTDYVPTLDQDIWPEELIPGTQIKYTLRYVSLSNKYTPKITIKLSEGLDYLLFSNIIKYPDGTSYNLEPTEISLLKERGFIYTNPYAANINGYRLYSSFYMMSMEENPYLHFDYINDKSNIQFISTNAFWNRPFSGEKKNKYTLTITLTQSVQENLGLTQINKNGLLEDESTPLVKCFAVFKRDGKEYRYRSMNLISHDDYSFTFSQEFDSLDIFDHDNNIKATNFQVCGQSEYTVTLVYGEDKYFIINNSGVVMLSSILSTLGIETEIDKAYSSNRRVLDVQYDEDAKDYKVISFNDFEGTETITIEDKDKSKEKIEISATSTQPAVTEYGFFNPTTEVKIYALCGLPDTDGVYSHAAFDAICPGMNNWTLTNTYDVVNGVTMYHNYSEIMGSRVEPYGKDLIVEDDVVLNLEGYYVHSVPMFGYDYCRNEFLVQSAINALNYRKAYIDSAIEILENSFGIDFKLFNTYGPSMTYYVIQDKDKNNVLDDNKEFIDKTNLTLYFRIKLVADNDSYTKDNIIQEIKSYIEDLDDLGELHIPNLVTQITNNYKEQITYFEYIGFNDYGPDIQHIYKLEDKEIPIHVAPEFINVNGIIEKNGSITPDINIYISEI